MCSKQTHDEIPSLRSVQLLLRGTARLSPSRPEMLQRLPLLIILLTPTHSFRHALLRGLYARLRLPQRFYPARSRHVLSPDKPRTESHCLLLSTTFVLRYCNIRVPFRDGQPQQNHYRSVPCSKWPHRYHNGRTTRSWLP